MSERGTITVRGSNIFAPPLLDASSDAAVIEIRDGFGELMGLLARLKDDVWGLTTRQDEDWSEVLIRYGYATTHQPLRESLARGNAGVPVPLGATMTGRR